MKFFVPFVPSFVLFVVIRKNQREMQRVLLSLREPSVSSASRR